MVDDFSSASVAWVLTKADLAHLGEAVDTCSEMVLDLETTGLNEHAPAARIVMASFTLPQIEDSAEPTTWVLPLSHPDSPWLGSWRRTLRGLLGKLPASTAVDGHNIKFDCRWIFAQVKVNLSHRIKWDSMVSSHELDENVTTRLKNRAVATFGIEDWSEGFDLSKPGAAEGVPLFDLGLYAARDTYWTWRLVQLHRLRMWFPPLVGDDPETPDEIEDARLGRLAYWCDMPTVAMLTAMEQRGMMLDKAWVKRELAEQLTAAATIGQKLVYRYEWLNPHEASFAPTSIWFRDFTEAAVKAGELTIAELTPTGKPRWSKNVLVRQARHGSEVARDLLDQRSASKKAEFLTSWLAHASAAGAIHSTYHVGSVRTGRLSSSDPNMQQVTASLKPAFVPRPGYAFADFDYGQIELRVAAFVSRCEPMIEAFQRGEDLHRLLSAKIMNKPAAEITYEERQFGKVANFGLLYQMSPYGFKEYAESAYGIAFTLDEATHIHQTFYETWEGIGAWHAKVIFRAQQTGQVSSPLGRVRRLPDIWSGNPRLASEAERAAINAPVQGVASNLLQMAAASIEGTLPGADPVRGAFLVGTIHDSLLAEVPADDWQPVVRQCQKRMTGIGDLLDKFDCKFDVPLVVNVSIGTRWGLHDLGELS